MRWVNAGKPFVTKDWDKNNLLFQHLRGRSYHSSPLPLPLLDWTLWTVNYDDACIKKEKLRYHSLQYNFLTFFFFNDVAENNTFTIITQTLIEQTHLRQHLWRHDVKIYLKSGEPCHIFSNYQHTHGVIWEAKSVMASATNRWLSDFLFIFVVDDPHL